MVTELIEAVKTGDVAAVQVCWLPVLILIPVTAEGQTLLMLAAHAGNLRW